MSVWVIYKGNLIATTDKGNITLNCKKKYCETEIRLIESDDISGRIGNIAVNTTYAQNGDGTYKCTGGTVSGVNTMPIKTLYKDGNGVNQFVTKIDDYAFSGVQFEVVYMPKKLSTIGEKAFSGNKLLKNVSFPNTLTTIEPRAFEDCTSLTSITIPSSVTLIGNWAFSGCINLQKFIYNGTQDNFIKIMGNQNPLSNTKVTYVNCDDGDLLWQ